MDVANVGERLVAVLVGPLFGGDKNGGGTIGQRSRVARGHGSLGATEDGLEGGKLLPGRNAEILVAVQALVAGHEVIKEALLVGLHEALVRVVGDLVLLFAGDTPALGGERLVLAHVQAGADLGSRGCGRLEVAGADVLENLEPVLRGLRGIEAVQESPKVIADLNRSIRRGVNAAANANLDLSEGNLVRDQADAVEPRGAGPLNIDGGCAGVESRSEDCLAGQVEILGVLEHSPCRDVPQQFSLERESRDESVECCGQHVLIADILVCLASPGKRNPVSAENRNIARIFHEVSFVFLIFQRYAIPRVSDTVGFVNPTTSTDRRSTRWDSHREQRRAELIDVARKLIHTDGPDVTMAAIAAASGTSKSDCLPVLPG